MARKHTQDETDFLDMLKGRSSTLHAWAATELDKGRTLHSLHAALQEETDIVRGWLIGRFGVKAPTKFLLLDGSRAAQRKTSK